MVRNFGLDHSPGATEGSGMGNRDGSDGSIASLVRDPKLDSQYYRLKPNQDGLLLNSAFTGLNIGVFTGAMIGAGAYYLSDSRFWGGAVGATAAIGLGLYGCMRGLVWAADNAEEEYIGPKKE